MLIDPEINKKVLEKVGGAPPLFHGKPIMHGGLGGVVRQAHRDKYQTEIDRIKYMGYNNEDTILNALIDTDGDIDRAVIKLSHPRP